MLTLTISQPNVAAAIARLKVSIQERAALAFESVGVEVIAYLRSLTDETRPPVRRGGRLRQAHPGHWADVSGQLALSYGYEVDRLPDGGVRLVLKNGAEYAAYLEARDGFFVLSEVADPGGPVDQALEKVLPVIAPGMRLVRR